jgi:hypothetical protein
MEAETISSNRINQLTFERTWASSPYSTLVCISWKSFFYFSYVSFAFYSRPICHNLKTNTEIAKELKITPVLNKIQDYKRNWIRHVHRMPRKKLPRLIKKLRPKRQKEPRKTTQETSEWWDRNGSISGPTPWLLHDDYDDIIICLSCLHVSFHTIKTTDF